MLTCLYNFFSNSYSSIDDSEENTNFWNKVSALGKIPGFVGDTYWFGIIIDLVCDCNPINGIGISLPGLTIGLLLSFYSTSSAIFCEYKINSNNQNSKKRHSSGDTIGDTTLTKTETLALFGYWLDQTGDRSSPLGLVAHIIGGDSWSKLAKAIIQCAALIIGGLSSVAEVKTAAHNLKDSPPAPSSSSSSL